MDTKQLQSILKQAGSVVLLDENGQPTAVAISWESWRRMTGAANPEPPTEEVPIASRWPKAPRAPIAEASRQDQILERLNKEILALKAQIEQDETGMQQ